MNNESRTTPRALVLGGGGAAGNAWLIGVVAGLHDTGPDVTEADLVIGTSAGSTAAAQLTGASPADLLAAILSTPPRPPSGRGPVPPGADHLATLREIIDGAVDAVDMRRRIGAAALARNAGSDGSGQARWRATVASRLPHSRWPDRRVLVTAVDARTGEPVVFDRHSGIELADAVAASCSNGVSTAAYRLDDNYYLDGGYRRNENADLAAGCGRVLVLSPLGGRTLHPLEWGMQLAAQVDELHAGGSRVETIVPDAASLAAFGGNMMDLSTRPSAARAGFEQGRALAPQLTEFWG